jgi:aminoglycoside phosphotransferase (APT) family kinase protein
VSGVAAPADPILEHIETNALRYFPGLASERIAVRPQWSKQRDNAQIYGLSVSTAGGEADVVVKVRHPRGASHPDDEELMPAVGDEFKLSYEYDALAAIEAQIGSREDPRFGAVRVLDLIPELGAFVMEAAPGQNLGSTFDEVLLRDGDPLSDELLVAARNTGAWLRACHGLPPMPQTEERSIRREAFLASLESLLEGAACDRWGHVDASELADRLFGVAAAVLPEELPAGVLHGDFRAGNVLADPKGRVFVIDTFANWRGPIYADLGHFLYQLALPPRWLSRKPSPRRLAALGSLEDEFLSGYFDEARVPIAAIRLFEAQALLYRWSRAARAARWPGREGWAKRARLRVKTRFFQDRLARILSDLDASARLTELSRAKR